jgi:hypothetical protein
MRNVAILAFLLGFAAFSVRSALAEQRQSGSTSGPAAGTTVEPSTAVEKQNPYILKGGQDKESGASGASAGALGVEGAPDTQSGKAPGAGK